MTANQITQLAAILGNTWNVTNSQIELLDTYVLRKWSKTYLLDLIQFDGCTDNQAYLPLGDTDFQVRFLWKDGTVTKVTRDSDALVAIKLAQHSQLFISFRAYGDTRVALVREFRGTLQNV